MLGMADAPVLRVVIGAGFDRALWLLEPPADVRPPTCRSHIEGHRALRQIVADVLAHAQDHAHERTDRRTRRRCSTWSPRARSRCGNARPPTAAPRP
jgi:hypothetical protein